jgi:protein involved in polysaccharide export with SLBB domain
VREPGGYAISALSTLFNALYMAGGPNKNGTFRQIKLIRNNKTILVNLYDFLIKGDKHCDLPLVSGDVIFVPLVGAQATIRGEVKRPAIYELTGGEKVSDLIALAGGPTADAHLGRLMLDRISEDDSRKVIDLDFTAEEKQDLLLADGDDPSIFSIYQMRQNIVWITGQVKHPGTFERSENTRISDLIEKGQLLPNNVHMERADLYRRLSNGRIEIRAISLKGILKGNSEDNILLADLDSLQIYCTDSVAQEKHVYIDGMVKNPGRYPLYDNMTVSDLIFLAGNLNENAYMLQAELARIDTNGNTSILYVPLNDRNDMILTENDHLFVRKIPGYQLHRMVTIEGEVLFPGRYSLTHKNETFWELLGRTGRFTRKAFPIGIVFKRKAIVEDLKRKNIADIVESSLPLMADSTGTLKPVKTISFEPESMDRIIVDMERLIATGGAEGDFKLQAGDYIFVPETPTGVTVMGEVCASGTITYEPGKKVKHYLEQAGGFTRRADKGQTRLVKANGRVYASGTALSKRADLGDVIIVPTEIKKERDWLKYFTTGASILTGVATTLLIFDRL